MTKNANLHVKPFFGRIVLFVLFALFLLSWPLSHPAKAKSDEGEDEGQSICAKLVEIPAQDLTGAEREWKKIYESLPSPLQGAIKEVDFDSNVKDTLVMILVLDREAMKADPTQVVIDGLNHPKVIDNRRLVMPEWFHEHLVFTREE